MTILNLKAIAGIQEIADCDAELYSGGQGFSYNRTNTAGVRVSETYTAGNSAVVDISSIREVTVQNHNGGRSFFSVVFDNEEVPPVNVGLNQGQNVGVAVQNQEGQAYIAIGSSPENAQNAARNLRSREMASVFEVNNSAGGVQNFFGSNSMYGA